MRQMYIRVRLTGTGTMDDPYTFNVPNGILVDADYQNGRAIVQVPTNDAPDQTDPPGTAAYPILNGKPVLVGLSPAQRLAWRVKLVRRWGVLFDFSQADVT